MGLFNRRKQQETSGPGRIPTPEEIDEAGKQLARGKSKLADKLAYGAGERRQQVAMAILAASVDYTPQES